jgi:hypothetical protein
MENSADRTSCCQHSRISNAPSRFVACSEHASGMGGTADALPQNIPPRSLWHPVSAASRHLTSATPTVQARAAPPVGIHGAAHAIYRRVRVPRRSYSPGFCRSAVTRGHACAVLCSRVPAMLPNTATSACLRARSVHIAQRQRDYAVRRDGEDRSRLPQTNASLSGGFIVRDSPREGRPFHFI